MNIRDRYPQPRSSRSVFAAAIGLLGTVLVGVTLAAENANSSVVRVNQRFRGYGYAELGALHSIWAASLPVDNHPLFDTADPDTGQPLSNIWFLGGSFAALDLGEGVLLSQANRQLTLPPGTALFFPIANVTASPLEGVGETEEELRAATDIFVSFIDPNSLFLTIDGKPVTIVQSLRAASPLFSFGPLPDNNLYEYFGLDAPAGTSSVAVGDGYYGFVKPLSVGRHTIHFGGTFDQTSVGGGLFILDITYEINVVPRGHG